MNEFELGLARQMGEECLLRLQKARIGIGGAGGLGSNAAFNLVRSGFKKFKIVDFDVVEVSNLDRQFFFLDQVGSLKVEALKANLKRINPDIDVDIEHKRVTAENIIELFNDCDAVLEAFDDVKYKILMLESFYSAKKLLVSVSGLAGCGRTDAIRVRKVHDTFYMVGDFETEVSEAVPPMSPRVNIAAAKQADIVLEYFMGKVTQ